MYLYGSPPRAWGQSLAARLLFRFPRFTPTGVGTIASRTAGAAGAAVHPHGRGDNKHYTFDGETLYGSPPRAWGQCLHRTVRRVAARFTPTGVGTIDGARRGARPRTVHPHGRGDNWSRRRCWVLCGGSPPRAWGQCRPRRPRRRRRRFTSTGVGTIAV